MKTILLTFDLEEFDLPRTYGINLKNNEYKLSYIGVDNVLKLLNKYNIKATFFTTAFFAQKYPILIKNISKIHEIALHGYMHSDNYEKQNKKEIFIRLQKAKKILEQILNKKIVSFRSQRFQKIGEETLKQIGIKIDSSLLPTYIPLSSTYTLGRFENLFKKRELSIHKGIIEVPLTVIPLLRLPFIWLVFRNMPLIYSKICTKLSLINNNFVNLIFHTWEFIDLSKFKLPLLIKRNTGNKLISKLEDYIKWCLKNNMKFNTVNGYVKNV